VVRVAKELSPDTETVIILDRDQHDAPVACVRSGAFDFLHQPISSLEVGEVIERAIGRRQLRTSTAMFRASHAILTGTAPQELPAVMVELAAELLSADGVSLYRRAAAGRLEIAYARGFSCESDEDDLLRLSERVTEGQAGAVPILLPDDATEEDGELGESSSEPYGRIRSAIICPILIEGRVAGILAAQRSADPRPFRRADAERTGVFASQLRLSFENARLLEKTVASERLAAIGELAAGVAHEINSPLTYVLGNCEAALDEVAALGERGNEIGSMLRDAKEGAERIREIAKDLRTLSRGRSESEVFDLSDAVRSALRVTRPTLRESLEVEVNLAPQMLVSGSPGRACQVFVNLLVNAAQAAAGVGRIVRLEIETQRQGDRIIATVRDHGPGIAPEHIGRVFDAFFTTKPAQTGTGLGLSITRAIVEDHGGTISVKSELGKSTTFVVDLPTASARKELGTPIRATEPRHPSVPPSRRPIKVPYPERTYAKRARHVERRTS
jgi:signal transduction histidine kinase